MYVCMYVCMYVWTYARTCVNLYRCRHTHTGIQLKRVYAHISHVLTHIRVHVCMYVCTHENICSLYMCICI